MRVLTYVDGVLTIINGDNFFKNEYERPEFITGNFYYEPTLQMCDGRKLYDKEIEKAEEFINTFEFDKFNNEYIEEVYHYIDDDGNYIGLLAFNNNYIKLDEKFYSLIPADTTELFNKYFNGSEFVNRVLINKETKKFISKLGDTRATENAEYAPDTIGETTFSLERYRYDKINNKWIIDIDEAKSCKISGLTNKCLKELNNKFDYNDLEKETFEIQFKEAYEYIKDNNFETKYIDIILQSRDLNENKLEFCKKILNKNDMYNIEKSKLLGKLQKLKKQVEIAETIDEIKLIVW